MNHRTANHRAAPGFVIAAIVLLDRVTKWWIVAHLPAWDMYTLWPGVFNIVHAENPGAAFGVLSDGHPLLRAIVLVGISTVVLMFIGRLLWYAPTPAAPEPPLLRMALALVFGGALGNLIDRILRGKVTDFVQVFIGSYEFPAFNVADSAITVGTALLIAGLARSEVLRRRGAA